MTTSALGPEGSGAPFGAKRVVRGYVPEVFAPPRKGGGGAWELIEPRGPEGGVEAKSGSLLYCVA